MWLWLATATVDDHLPTTPLPIEWCHRSLPCQIALNRHRRYPMGSFTWTTNLPSSFKLRQSGIQKKRVQQGRSFLILPFRQWKTHGVAGYRSASVRSVSFSSSSTSESNFPFVVEGCRPYFLSIL